MIRVLLIAILIIQTYGLNAQYFVDNLFVRYQWAELRKYRRLGINNPPLKCAPNRMAKDIWGKAEQQLSKHNLALLQQNRWEEEITFYKACIKEDSSFCDAYYRLVQCLVERTDWTGAINLLNLAQRKFPNDPLIYLGFGQAYLFLNFRDVALKNFEKVILLMPTSTEGWLGASMASYETGNVLQALGYLRQGYKSVDGDIEYLKVFEAILLYHSHRTQAAYDLLYDLQNPKSSTISTDGLSYTTLRKNGIMDPQLNALAEYYMGLCIAAKGEDSYSSAHYHFKIASRDGIFIDSTLSRAYGFSMVADDLKEQLLSTYHPERVTDKKNSDPKATEAFENREIDKAIVLFSDRIKQDSLNLYSYFKLAECYQLKQEPQKALAVYKLAAKKFPKDDRAKMKLIRQLVRVDSLSSAFKLTEGQIKKHPGKMEPYFQASLILVLMNKTKEAVDLMKELELRYVGNEQNTPWKIPSILGELHYLLRNYGVAIGYFNFAIQYGALRDPYLNYYYAQCLGKKGDAADAKKYFYNAMSLGAILDKDAIQKFQLVEKQSSPYGEKY